jgi:hypothetical protein
VKVTPAPVPRHAIGRYRGRAAKGLSGGGVSGQETLLGTVVGLMWGLGHDTLLGIVVGLHFTGYSWFMCLRQHFTGYCLWFMWDLGQHTLLGIVVGYVAPRATHITDYCCWFTRGLGFISIDFF